MNNILFTILFVTSAIFAQDRKPFPVITNDDINDIKIERTEYYDGNSLWGLINGGADIYLEYGFDELAFQSINWQDENFRVEIYKMESDEAAFGIFSVSRFKCDINDTLTKFICITKYQVQAAIGRYYISIANNKGNTSAMNLTIQLFAKVLSKIDEKAMTLPSLFQKKNFAPYMDKLKFIKGDLGFMNSFPMWADKFSGYGQYGVYILPVKNDEGYVNIAQIHFTDETDLKNFIEDNPESKERIVKILSNKTAELIETNLTEANLHKLIK